MDQIAETKQQIRSPVDSLWAELRRPKVLASHVFGAATWRLVLFPFVGFLVAKQQIIIMSNPEGLDGFLLPSKLVEELVGVLYWVRGCALEGRSSGKGDSPANQGGTNIFPHPPFPQPRNLGASPNFSLPAFSFARKAAGTRASPRFGLQSLKTVT